MSIQKTILSLLCLAGMSPAWDAPVYDGYNRLWQDSFTGLGSTLPDGKNWNVITGYLDVNAELQVYTSAPSNVQLSGHRTLQLIPQRDSLAQSGWTSGRVESTYVFTPQPGEITRVESAIRFGDGPIAHKQGIWPAFWMLGSIHRNGGGWPSCGEVDIMETINGQLTGYGTIHCDVYPGGICREGAGIGGSIAIADQDWHTWRVDIDRTKAGWQQETITWFQDGLPFHQVSGARIASERVWNSLAHSPLYFILNVAVGGSWPGYPDDDTLDGWGSMMEVGYVAQYSTI